MTQHNNTWKEVQLGDHVDLLTGYPFKSKQFTQDDNDIRLLRGDNVAQGFLRWNDAKRWSREEYEAYSSCHLLKGDVILAMDRPWISAGLKYAWIKEGDLPCLLVQRVARLRGTDGLLTDYLRYVIGSHDFTNHVLSITTGVNVPHISGRDIKAFRFKLPPEPVQERVVSILSAYDDLIENNTRRIEILEEMARRLYEEWFVHFRFPGHEEVSFKESELGEIPEGWEVAQFKNVATNFDRMRKPLSKKQRAERQGSYPYYGAAKVFDYIDDYIFDGRYLLLAEDGSVIDKDGFPILQMANGKFWANNHTHILQGKSPASTEFLYLALSGHPISGYITGAAQPKITQANMNRIPLVMANLEIHDAFDQLVKPMFDMQETLEKKNSNLRTQRDLLLPKLVSGEIDVSDIPMPDDKEVEAA